MHRQKMKNFPSYHPSTPTRVAGVAAVVRRRVTAPQSSWVALTIVEIIHATWILVVDTCKWLGARREPLAKSLNHPAAVLFAGVSHSTTAYHERDTATVIHPWKIRPRHGDTRAQLRRWGVRNDVGNPGSFPEAADTFLIMRLWREALDTSAVRA